MNRIVKEFYPVEKLPDDLRAGFEGKRLVRVVIEEAQAGKKLSRQELIDRLSEIRANPIGDDPVARIRELRDEWDD